MDHQLPASAMTLRDYFAAQALIGYLVAPARSHTPDNWVALAAYATADAMLEARDK